MIRVLKPGLQTSIQDGGRPGWMAVGVPRGGAMDQGALRSANRCVGNPPGAAALEIFLEGPHLAFDASCRVAVAGARFDLLLNGASCRSVFFAQSGDQLRFGPLQEGCRAYVAVEGGIDVPLIMGSRSTLPRAGLPGLAGRLLKRGDPLPIGQPGIRSAGREPPLRRSTPTLLSCLRGPEWDWFTPDAQSALHSELFQVSPSSDRMGYRLSGPALSRNHADDMVTSGLLPGTLQVTPDGASILAMRDAQTTGGYPRMVVLTSAAIDLAAQLKPGDRFHFEVVETA